MKTLKEQIEVMRHFDDGGEVEVYFTEDGYPAGTTKMNRIGIGKITITESKRQRKRLLLKKWLTHNKMFNTYSVLETSKIDIMGNSVIRKVKLLDSYEVELCD